MNFGLSETQTLLQDTVRDYVTRNVSTEIVRSLMETETAFDKDFWDGLNDLGLVALTVPEDLGGFGMGAVELAAVSEVLGGACVPGPLFSNQFALSLYAALCPEGERLGDWVEGRTLGTVAVLEEGMDWNQNTGWFEAVTSIDGFVLHGTKILVWDAERADSLLIAATLDGEPALFLLSGTEPGLTITATPGLDATRKLYQLDFNSVTIPDSALLAEGSSVRTTLEESMRLSTVAVCAEMVGCMQRILDLSVEYARIRHQFGRPIGAFQAVQHLCADMFYWLESARSATYYAAYMVSVNDPEAGRYVSIAKAYVSEVAPRAAHAGIQVHGGIGFTWEHDMHLYFKRILANEISFGNAVWHREQLAVMYIDHQR